ncbi:speriolin-like protein [Callorhinchus milii]|uniref:Spermatosis and centriole associated 1 like n=1 Tax=Callorhinchus milii TaxID=7868 RepID=A0A4W3J9M0_CALMI|nr:speriolin-like protein [Callorhinchus milii]|eukprot:gi/632980931/ref/XP_007907312.1/ PREDICTED: speriolin-like protein [Callorhinchus milii]
MPTLWPALPAHVECCVCSLTGVTLCSSPEPCGVTGLQERQASPTLQNLLTLSLSDDPRSLTYGSSLPSPHPSKLPSYCRSPQLYEKRTPNVPGGLPDEEISKQLPDAEAHNKAKKIWFSESANSEESKKLFLEEGNKTRVFYVNEMDSFSNLEKNSRVIGEIAFQLDRRILANVFPGLTRLYGYTVSNIPSKIKQNSINPLDGSVDKQKWRQMTQTYTALLSKLEKLNYNNDIHTGFSEFLINTYGILKQRPNAYTNITYNPIILRKMVIDMVPAKFLRDTLVLLNCLCELSRSDKKPLFPW